MRPLVVVPTQPISGHVPDLLQVVEHKAVQHFGAVRSVESLDIGVLCGFLRLDVIEGNAL